MKENLLIDKSISFASRIIKLHKYLIKTQKETIISLLNDCLEIKRILIASINTARDAFTTGIEQCAYR